MNNFEKLHKFINEININVTEKDLLNVLQIHKRWTFRSAARAYHDVYGMISMVDDLGVARYNTIFDHEGYLIYEKFLKYYNDGFTMIICDVMDCFEELREINKKSLEYVGIESKGNFYFSKSGNKAASLVEHKDPYKIIVKNIYGETKWSISEKEFILKDQNSIFLDKNIPHAVIQNITPRLSCTISYY